MPAMLEPSDYLRNQASVTEPACAVILSEGSEAAGIEESNK